MNIDFKKLADKYQTPYYVYDFDHITAQYTELKESFRARKSLIAYAVKANSNLSVIKHLATLGAGADCVSIGEVKRALKVGIPSYKIIFSGVGKSDDEIREALKLDILLINVESAEELNRVELIAKELNKIARISIRVNPNIDPKTHPYISTGLHENKFGVDIDTAKRMYIQCKNSEFLEPTGIHCHIDSQLTQLQPIKDAIKIVADLVRNLKAIKIELSFMDVGGGLGIVYKDETLINTYEYVNGNKRFVIVDGAMNDLIRPALYNAYHRIEVLNDNKEFCDCNIVGPVCESGDFFAKNIELPKTTHNDLVAIYSAGAYGFTMASNYNTRGRVAEIAVENEIDRLIRRRETFEDLIALEEEFIK